MLFTRLSLKRAGVAWILGKKKRRKEMSRNPKGHPSSSTFNPSTTTSNAQLLEGCPSIRRRNRPQRLLWLLCSASTPTRTLLSSDRGHLPAHQQSAKPCKEKLSGEMCICHKIRASRPPLLKIAFACPVIKPIKARNAQEPPRASRRICERCLGSPRALRVLRHPGLRR